MHCRYEDAESARNKIQNDKVEGGRKETTLGYGRYTAQPLRTEPHSAAIVRRSEQIKDCWAITTRFVGVLQGDSTEGGTILCCNRAAVGADCGFSETAKGASLGLLLGDTEGDEATVG